MREWKQKCDRPEKKSATQSTERRMRVEQCGETYDSDAVGHVKLAAQRATKEGTKGFHPVDAHCDSSVGTQKLYFGQ